MNIRIFLSYDGTNYYGWQRQEKFLTVQEVVQTHLKDILGQDINLIGSGRTDRGVHAKMQVANFRVVQLPFDIEKLPRILTGKLPRDISCWFADIVEDNFHARFSAKAKTYRYFFYIGPFRNPFIDRYALRMERLDGEVISSCCDLFLGRHDFSMFSCSANPKEIKPSAIREILGCRFKMIKRYNIGYIEVTASGFLYKMVRRIVGIILDVHNGRLSLEDIYNALSGCLDKEWTTAPAKGLVLWKVTY